MLGSPARKPEPLATVGTDADSAVRIAGAMTHQTAFAQHLLRIDRLCAEDIAYR